MDDPLAWLSDWFEQQCDGNWEHDFGIVVESSDNPGWIVKIDLSDTDLQQKTFPPMVRGSQTDSRWLVCKVEDSRFTGAGGPQDLVSIIEVFREWATSS